MTPAPARMLRFALAVPCSVRPCGHYAVVPRGATLLLPAATPAAATGDDAPRCEAHGGGSVGSRLSLSEGATATAAASVRQQAGPAPGKGRAASHQAEGSTAEAPDGLLTPPPTPPPADGSDAGTSLLAAQHSGDASTARRPLSAAAGKQAGTARSATAGRASRSHGGSKSRRRQTAADMRSTGAQRRRGDTSKSSKSSKASKVSKTATSGHKSAAKAASAAIAAAAAAAAVAADKLKVAAASPASTADVSRLMPQSAVLVTVGKTAWPAQVLQVNRSRRIVQVQFDGTSQVHAQWVPIDDVQAVEAVSAARRRRVATHHFTY